MAYIELKFGEIDTSIVYVSQQELIKATGVPRNTLNHQIRTNKLDAYKFRGRVFFHPDVAEEYIALHKCGLLGRKKAK